MNIKGFEIGDLRNIPGIYKITNLINNKIYIGSSNNICLRWRKHINTLRSKTHNNPYLQRSFNKYGEENFEFSIIRLGIPSMELLLEMEQFYLDTLNPDYNFNKIANANLDGGWSLNQEQRKKIADSKKGKKWSQESRDKLSKTKKGKNTAKWSLETKIAVSKKRSGYNKIHQYDRDMNFIKEWDNLYEISEGIGLSKKSIYNYATNNSKRPGKFIWIFKQ